jgi:cell division protein FtsQ
VGRRPPVDPRIRQRRASVQRSRGRRRLHWIVAALVVVVLAVGAVALLHTPWFRVRVVTVTGSHPHTPTAAIIAASGLDGHPPLVDVPTGATAAKVAALPFIASAQVRRHWPDGVAIAVTERVPTVTMSGPGPVWSVLDSQGRTLETVPSRPPGLVLLVVHAATGPVLPAAVGATLAPTGAAGLAVCRTLPPAFAAQVLSVTVAGDGTVSLALNSGITVLLGTGDDLPAKYEDVAAIIAHADLRGATTIDVTVPQSPTVSG